MKTNHAKTRTGRGFAITLLLLVGCGSGGYAAGGRGGGGAGTSGGSSGNDNGGSAGGTVGGTGEAGTGGGAVGAPGGGSGGTDAAWLTPSQVPPTLVAPAGATVKVHDHAVGVQIYTCTAGGGGTGGAATYSWVFKAPEANLFDSGGAQVGTHGAGPHWASSDGSVVNGTTITQSASPTGDAIPWLLLRATAWSGTAGLFSDVSYVQRLNTSGGKAPATGCDSMSVGTELRVGYAADYYFYTGGAGAAWLEPPADLPIGIRVPDAHVLKLHDHAIGVQTYTCTASGGNDGGTDAGAARYSWVFKAPDAVLYDPSFTAVGTHGAGPTWTSTDGSAITGRELARADSPLPDTIPWLLLKQFSSAGTGVFSDVDIVQRLNTAGGAAPPDSACDATTVNSEARVGYAADYYFYRSADGAGATAP